MVSCMPQSWGAAMMPPTTPASSAGNTAWLTMENQMPNTKGTELSMVSMPASQKEVISRPSTSTRRAAPFLRGVSGSTPGPGRS